MRTRNGWEKSHVSRRKNRGDGKSWFSSHSLCFLRPGRRLNELLVAISQLPTKSLHGTPPSGSMRRLSMFLYEVDGSRFLFVFRNRNLTDYFRFWCSYCPLGPFQRVLFKNEVGLISTRSVSKHDVIPAARSSWCNLKRKKGKRKKIHTNVSG